MKLILEETSEKAAEFAALYIRKRINDFNPTADRPFTLGLHADQELLGMYEKLVQLHKEGKVSFKHVITFNTEEFIAFPRENIQSVHTFMLKNFFRHIDIIPANVNILDGNAEDLELECKKYEEKMKGVGGIELFVASSGPDGRLAFNEPGSSLNTRTRVKTFSHETQQDLSRLFQNNAIKAPTQALTVGVQTLMDAREVMIMVTGVQKSIALHRAIEEGISHMCTLSAFQMHPKTTFIADENATLELKVKTVKYFKGLMPHHMKMIQSL